jgi:predicted short-subunit dehydrogenase-like oxidoreductase (DUF2520 family)
VTHTDKFILVIIALAALALALLAIVQRRKQKAAKLKALLQRGQRLLLAAPSSESEEINARLHAQRIRRLRANAVAQAHAKAERDLREVVDELKKRNGGSE